MSVNLGSALRLENPDGTGYGTAPSHPRNSPAHTSKSKQLESHPSMSTPWLAMGDLANLGSPLTFAPLQQRSTLSLKTLTNTMAVQLFVFLVSNDFHQICGQRKAGRLPFFQQKCFVLPIQKNITNCIQLLIYNKSHINSIICILVIAVIKQWLWVDTGDLSGGGILDYHAAAPTVKVCNRNDLN